MQQIGALLSGDPATGANTRSVRGVEQASYGGTLHVGNMCNNNYKLAMALRGVGVDAHLLMLERVRRSTPVNDPANYDNGFSAASPYIHIVPVRYRSKLRQRAFELAEIRTLVRHLSRSYWVHAQTDYPIFVRGACAAYSAHSTGSDIRTDYFQFSVTGRLLRRAYRCARVAFYNNIDLGEHELARFTRFRFLPNAVDLSKYPAGDSPRRNDGLLHMLLPSRITLWAHGDIKGHGILQAALETVSARGLRARIVVPAEDPEAGRFRRLCAQIAPNIGVVIKPFRNSKTRYLSEIRHSDLVLDQFALGCMGGIALDSFAMGRVSLTHIAPSAFRACYGEEPLLPALDTPFAVAEAILSLSNATRRAEMQERVRAWVTRCHAASAVAAYFLGELASVGVCVSRQGCDTAYTSGPLPHDLTAPRP